MKREILFRGKRLDTGGWVYGSLIDSGNHSQVAIFPYNDSASTMSVRQLVYLGMVSVAPNTVGQFTGMTDKMGKRIFDGDILMVKNEDVFAESFVVRYGHCGGIQNVDHEVGYVGFYVEPVGIGAAELLAFGMRTDILYWLNEYEIEVVGNAFDNQELLEVKSRWNGLV